ncbi:cupin domain-containing protein [Rhodovulum sp. DZ06]|uniref:cupin domain-containing protein n=1 Tax=Rhodovulum sp. DZ06 TaxID=3425126 RepID=UPI003D32F7CB
MKCIAAAALVLGLAAPAFAEDPAPLREELRRVDLAGVEGTEVRVARLTLKPGATVPRHTHHGDEFLYVETGGMLTAGNGKEIPFSDGMTAHFPRGLVHGGLTNNTGQVLVVITTHVVDKGKPLNVPAE